jgi:hypothetical protein
MTASRVNWAAFVTTAAACCLVDGGLYFLAWRLTGEPLVAVFAFLIVGGPITLLMAVPTYARLKTAFERRVEAPSQ